MKKLSPLVLLTLAACGGQGADLEAVRLLLVDPSSAEFDAVEVRGDTTCGLVNAKNRYGGFVGNRAFIVTAGKAEIEKNLGDFATRFAAECTRATSERYLDLLAGRTDAYEAMTGAE